MQPKVEPSPYQIFADEHVAPILAADIITVCMDLNSGVLTRADIPERWQQVQEYSLGILLPQLELVHTTSDYARANRRNQITDLFKDAGETIFREAFNLKKIQSTIIGCQGRLPHEMKNVLISNNYNASRFLDYLAYRA